MIACSRSARGSASLRVFREKPRMEKTAARRFGPERGPIWRIGLVIAVGVVGVMMMHHPMIGSGFRRIQTDLGDTRLIHYMLEHGYLWAQRDARHLEFWSPPFFYPVKNAAAYSDVLLSVGPVYWITRALGASPDVSFGLWMIAMSALNYAAGLLLFKKGLGFGTPAAVAGASLVAFGAPRVNQLNHQQLLPFFFPLLALFAISRLFAERPVEGKARWGYWLLATSAMVAQLYAAVYPAWLLLAALAISAIAATAMPSCRQRMFAVFWRDSWAIAVSCGVALFMLQPFLAHYLPAAREVQTEYLPEMRALHPSIGSWLDMGPRSWIWGWASHPGWAHGLDFLEDEHLLGIGLLTTIACATGLYLGRSRPLCILAAATAGFLWLATTYMPGDYLATLATVAVCYCELLGCFTRLTEGATGRRRWRSFRAWCCSFHFRARR